MQPDEAPAFKQLMQGVHDFYNRDLSEFALSVWWGAMKPYEFAEVKHALNRHLVDPDAGVYMPKPADVVRVLDGNRSDTAAMAWAKFMRALTGAWASESLLFDDPAIHAVIRDMGGWPKVATITNDELPFRQREFEAKYRAYRNRGTFDYPAVLAGTADANNVPKGYAPTPPKLIGEPSKCLQVKASGNDKSESLPLLTGAITKALERHA